MRSRLHRNRKGPLRQLEALPPLRYGAKRSSFASMSAFCSLSAPTLTSTLQPQGTPGKPKLEAPGVKSKVNTNNNPNTDTDEALKHRRMKLLNDTWGMEFVV